MERTCSISLQRAGSVAMPRTPRSQSARTACQANSNGPWNSPCSTSGNGGNGGPTFVLPSSASLKEDSWDVQCSFIGLLCILCGVVILLFGKTTHGLYNSRLTRGTGFRSRSYASELQGGIGELQTRLQTVTDHYNSFADGNKLLDADMQAQERRVREHHNKLEDNRMGRERDQFALHGQQEALDKCQVQEAIITKEATKCAKEVKDLTRQAAGVFNKYPTRNRP